MKAFNRTLKQLQELLGKAMPSFKLKAMDDGEVIKQECDSCNKWFGLSGAVRFVSFSKAHLWSLIYSRKIAYSKIEGRIYIQRSELLRCERIWQDRQSGKSSNRSQV